ncbi:EamA family transporter [Bartonella sp. DGB2]|uniref:EamA family transporter n=1 Tax=Bartonella sp. DGB2 TaxID=3388426 RepID=UPI00398FCE03
MFIVPTRNIISFIGSFVLGYINSNGKKISYVKPHIVVLIQLLVGAIVLSPFANFSVLINFRVKELSYLFIFGFVHSCITYILMYSSYHRLSAVSIAILTFIYPAIAILVDFYFYGKILNLYQWIGFFLIMFSGFSANQNLGSKWFERKAKIG